MRLPSGFPLGAATIQIGDPGSQGVSNAFPITVSATPGTPVITNALNSDSNPTTTINADGSFYLQADGIDTLGAVVRFQQGTNVFDVTAGTAFSNSNIHLIVQVSVPSNLAAGPVSVSVRQGSSGFSSAVTLTVQ